MIGLVTLSNGHTYAHGSNNNFYDLTEHGAIYLGDVNGVLEADGSLWSRDFPNGDHVVINKHLLLSFDNKNMPVWGDKTTMVTTPTITPSSPVYYINNTIGSSTNPNRYIFFNPNYGNKDIGDGKTPYGMGYHFGSIKFGNNKWDWQTSKSTSLDYHGDYPRNGDFDIGNSDYGGGQHSENCTALVNESNFFWHVNGEFWQTNSGVNNGVNIWNHYNEDGLLIANFGVTGLESQTLLNNAGNAGNSFSASLIKLGKNYYIYHCDESQWGGIHSWKIDGLNTISEQNIAVALNPDFARTTITDQTDLMAGLPFLSRNFTGNNNWTVEQPLSGMSMLTNYYQYSKNAIDLLVGGYGKQVVNCTFNNQNSLNSWTFKGQICFGSGEPTLGDNYNSDNYNYLELIDSNGKIIARFSDAADTRNSYYHTTYINNLKVKYGNPSDGSYPFARSYYKDFSFNYDGKSLYFQYKDYAIVNITTAFEREADISKPSYVRINQSSPGNQYHVMDVCNFNFIKSPR